MASPQGPSGAKVLVAAVSSSPSPVAFTVSLPPAPTNYNAGLAMTLTMPPGESSTSPTAAPETDMSTSEDPTTPTPATPSPMSSSTARSTGGAKTLSTSLLFIPTGSNTDTYLSTPVPSDPAAQQSDSADAPPPNNGLPFSTPILAGIIVGGVVFFLLTGACCWLLGRQRRRQARKTPDDALGAGIEWRRRSGSQTQSRSHSQSRSARAAGRAGYSRSDDPKNIGNRDRLAPPGQSSRSGLSRAEARASVQLGQLPYPPRAYNSETLAAPPRSFGYAADDAATGSSAWTDNSEMDVFAVDGSTIARTLSTMSRPNSEYDLDDPGATWAGGSYLSHDGTRTQNPVPAQRYNPYEPSNAPSSQFTSPTSPTYSGQVAFAQQAQRVQPPQQLEPLRSQPPAQHLLPPDAVRSLAGPSQRIPAPRLLIDTKAPFDQHEGVPLSAMSRGATPGPSAAPSATWGPPSATLRTPLDRAPSSASRVVTPEPGWAYAVRNGGSAAPSPSAYHGAVARSASRSAADRPTALPYASAHPSPSATFGRTTPIAAHPQSPTTPTQARPGGDLRRGPTIIRHADAGIAFEDAVPDGEGDEELHLPPAYGDIYGPPA